MRKAVVYVMEERIALVNRPEISAIYFALLQCGYEYYTVEKEPDLAKRIGTFRATRDDSYIPFFSGVRGNTCAVYPYWPRAAALETASFFLTSGEPGFVNFDAFRKDIMSADNLSDSERDAAFWEWVKDFPAALKRVLASEAFKTYFKWEGEWIERQNLLYQDHLRRIQEILHTCARDYSSPVRRISVVLNPIKCAYAADYHITGDALVFCSGAFRPESVAHEFLHHVVHPLINKCRSAVRSHAAYPNIDPSYYLDGGEDGKLNAFEEYVVRQLTGHVVALDFPPDIGTYIDQISCKLSP